MRGRCFALAVMAMFALTGVAPAQDDADDEAEEFDTTWVGVRLGLFYRPEMNMKVQVSGDPDIQGLPGFLTGLLGTTLDIHDDLGVTETVASDYMFQNGILEAEVFFDTRWASVAIWGIAPYEYEGDTTLSRTINFGGQQFTASTQVESRFRQYHGGVDVKINILNNQFVRLSPMVGLRILGVDWEVHELTTGLKGDTSDIDTPLHYDDAAIIPYPEVGAEVRIGLRQWLEADLKISGSYFTYGGLEGGTMTLDAGVTGYPIPFVGVRLGVRYMDFDIQSRDDDDPDDSFDMDLEYLGATISLIVRFG